MRVPRNGLTCFGNKIFPRAKNKAARVGGWLKRTTHSTIIDEKDKKMFFRAFASGLLPSRFPEGHRQGTALAITVREVLDRIRRSLSCNGGEDAQV